MPVAAPLVTAPPVPGASSNGPMAPTPAAPAAAPRADATSDAEVKRLRFLSVSLIVVIIGLIAATAVAIALH